MSEQLINSLRFYDGILGLLVRRARQGAGYRTTEEFSEAIRERTGYEIKPGAVQRIESGAQEMKVAQYVAVALTLFGEIPTTADAYQDPLASASCAEWNEASREGRTRRQDREGPTCPPCPA